MKHLQNLFLLLLIVFVALTGCARKVTYKPGVAPPDRALMQVDTSGMDFNDDLDIASLVLAIDRSLAYYDGAGRNQMFRIDGPTGWCESDERNADRFQRDSSIQHKR
ncbi:MAG: hypothetical protein MZV70_27000 [Desulfobacterales bacterium]|nr:hypothetical protein [Desulfobacterales bacterium]